MFKKPIVPILLILSVAVGIYFLFFYTSSPTQPASGDTETLASSENPNDKEEDTPKTPDEIERETRRREAQNPANYLKLNYEFRNKLIGGFEATGTILNDADETYYKNTEVRMYFIDRDGIKTDSVSEIIFDEFGPGDKVNFEMDQDAPKKTKLIELKVITAEVSE